MAIEEFVILRRRLRPRNEQDASDAASRREVAGQAALTGAITTTPSMTAVCRSDASTTAKMRTIVLARALRGTNYRVMSLSKLAQRSLR